MLRLHRSSESEVAMRHLLLPLALTGSISGADAYANMPDKPRFLGVEMSPPSMQTQEKEGLTPNQGVQIQSVFTGTAAERAGIAPGDVVLAINGAPITSMSDLRNEVSMSNVGDNVSLTLARNGTQIERATTVQAWPANIPFEPIDAAAEQRFRDWQEKRLSQAQDEIRKVEQDIQQTAKALGLGKDPIPTPDELAQERVTADAELVLGIPGANPLNGWRLRFRCHRSTDPAVTAPVDSVPGGQGASPPYRLGVSLVTPDADRQTL